MNTGEYRRMFEAEDRHWWYVGLHELVLTIVERVAAASPGPLLILDAGCGTGRLMQLMQPFGAVEGCDRAPAAVAFCRQRGLEAVVTADLNRAAFPAGRFDVITVIDVLYHREIRDEVAVLAALRDALKPGGVLIRNDPAFAALRGVHDEAVHGRRRYRTGEVRRRLEAAGLVPEILTYRLAALAPLIAAHRIARRLLARGPTEDARSDLRAPHPFANRLLRAVARLDNRSVLGRGLPFGSSVFAVARRPSR